TIIFIGPNLSAGRLDASTIFTRIQYIQNPEEVFKFFKKVSYDMKTDVQFPNKLRPKNNPGYNTNYK
ncbi:hypothetical protein BVX95_01720, partial [archaeon D22]